MRQLPSARRNGRRRARVADEATGLAREPSACSLCGRCIIAGKTDAEKTLIEVGGRGGPRSPVPAVVDRATRPVEGMRESARVRRSGFQANPYRSAAGRGRIRQRKASHLYSAATRSAKRGPYRTRNENLARAQSTPQDATSVLGTGLPAPISSQEPVQFGEMQALGPCAQSLAAHPDASSSVARIESQ